MSQMHYWDTWQKYGFGQHGDIFKHPYFSHENFSNVLEFLEEMVDNTSHLFHAKFGKKGTLL